MKLMIWMVLGCLVLPLAAEEIDFYRRPLARGLSLTGNLAAHRFSLTLRYQTLIRVAGPNLIQFQAREKGTFSRFKSQHSVLVQRIAVQSTTTTRLALAVTCHPVRPTVTACDRCDFDE